MTPPIASIPCFGCATALKGPITRVAYCLFCENSFCRSCIATSSSAPADDSVAEENICTPCSRRNSSKPFARNADLVKAPDACYKSLRIVIPSFSTRRFGLPRGPVSATEPL